VAGLGVLMRFAGLGWLTFLYEMAGNVLPSKMTTLYCSPLRL
jgi:hypothetical protein